MFLVPSSSILNLVPWMLSVLVLSVNFSALTTLSSVNLVLGTTGPKAITQRVQNW